MIACRCVCRTPCGKQHFREIPTPDFVSKCTNQAYYLVEAIVVKSLQNPAWVFRGNVVSHMGHKPCSEQKNGAFSHTHDLTKGLSYVSTQKSGQFDTFVFNHFSVHCNLAWLWVLTYESPFAKSWVRNCAIFWFAIPSQTPRHSRIMMLVFKWHMGVIILCVRETHRHASQTM